MWTASPTPTAKIKAGRIPVVSFKGVIVNAINPRVARRAVMTMIKGRTIPDTLLKRMKRKKVIIKMDSAENLSVLVFMAF